MKRTLKILGLSFLTIIIAISSILGIIYWVYDVPMANVDGGGYIFGDDSSNGYCGWPSVACAEGKIYCAYAGYRKEHVYSNGKICLAISDENNINFENTIVYESDEDERDTGILYLGNGNFMLTFITWERPSNLHYPKYMISNDYCQTWSDVMDIDMHSPHGPTLLDNGDILYLGHNLDTADFYALISKDSGQTWERGADVPIPSNVNKKYLWEPYAIQLSDGSIFGAVKYKCLGYSEFYEESIFFTRSYDGGYTWTELEYSNLNGIPPHMFETSDNKLILAYGRRAFPQSIRYVVSEDGGKTFSKEKKLVSQWSWDFGYPATTELSDGSLFTVWYGKKSLFQKNNYIYYIKWHL